MTAQNTDKLLKVASNTGWQIGASGVADDTVTTIPLVSASGLPTDTAVLITIGRVDSSGNQTPSKMERVLGVVSGNNLVNCIRGVEGTAQSHAGGAVVEIVISASNINKLIDAFLAEHNQSGEHVTDLSALASSVSNLETGWTPYSAVIPTRTSADDPYFEIQFAGVDLTSVIRPGMNFKFDQNSTTRYFKVKESSFSTNTTIKLYGGAGYDVDDTGTYAISNVYYSIQAMPTGFPLILDRKPFCSLTNSSVFQIPNNSATILEWDTESFDEFSMFDSGTDNTVIVAKEKGIYTILVEVEYTPDGAPSFLQTYIRKNDSTISATPYDYRSNGSSRVPGYAFATTELNVGDEIDVAARIYYGTGGEIASGKAKIQVSKISE